MSQSNPSNHTRDRPTNIPGSFQAASRGSDDNWEVNFKAYGPGIAVTVKHHLPRDEAIDLKNDLNDILFAN